MENRLLFLQLVWWWAGIPQTHMRQQNLSPSTLEMLVELLIIKSTLVLTQWLGPIYKPHSNILSEGTMATLRPPSYLWNFVRDRLNKKACRYPYVRVYWVPLVAVSCKVKNIPTKYHCTSPLNYGCSLAVVQGQLARKSVLVKTERKPAKFGACEHLRFNVTCHSSYVLALAGLSFSQSELRLFLVIWQWYLFYKRLVHLIVIAQ